MRRSLGTLTATLLTCAALLFTAGCGSSSSSVAMDPASDPAGNPSRAPGPVAGAHVLPLISMTGAGGRVQTRATLLSTHADIASFARQFRVPAIRHRIITAVDGAHAGRGEQVYGQIVAVGCDRPPGADVVVTEAGDVQLLPHEVASPLEECLAAVTTVAIAVLPSR